MRKRITKVRRKIDGHVHTVSDTSVSGDKKNIRPRLTKKRVRIQGDNVCAICKHEIGGRKVQIGNNVCRCMDCYPGSPNWLESDVGKNSKWRHYFVDASERRKEAFARRPKIEVPDVKEKIIKERKRIEVRRIVVKKERKRL